MKSPRLKNVESKIAFGQLILRKIIKTVATSVTRCQIILRLKCAKIQKFGWSSAPDPAAGAYNAPLDPLAGFKGPTSKGRGGSGGDGRGRNGRGGEGRGVLWSPKILKIDPVW